LNISPGPTAKVFKGTSKKDEPDQLERLLYEWVKYMRSGQLEKWYPGHSTGLSTGGASETFEDLLERCERNLAKITDTVIKDLPVIQSCAIHHKYLHAVFRFRSDSTLSHALELAKTNLRIGLKNRGVL
jgi:hypothetical protein